MKGTRQRSAPSLDPGLLHADEDDRPFVRPRHRPLRAYLNVLALLVIIAAAVYGLLLLNGLLGTDVALPLESPPASLPQPRSIPVPPIYTTDALSTPKPLADCIKPDNIIEEAVATCRYGHFPRAADDSKAQGMVSASYMARYKAEQQPARSRRTVAANVERATVWQWDGKRTYAAQWSFTDNRIEGSSVCANYRRGSIEYRECRKGAKVYFREKCREWGNRRSQQRSDASQALEQRFCSAGDGFNPLG